MPCSAQKKFQPFEVYAGIGVLPQYEPYLADVVDSWQSTIGSSSTMSYFERAGEKNNLVAFHAGFLFRPSRNFAVGLALSQANGSYDAVGLVYREGSPQLTRECVGTVQSRACIIMFNTEYTWLTKGVLSLYSKAGFGTSNVRVRGENGIIPSISELSESKHELVWQFMPFCADWHFLKNLALYAESGYSGTGCVACGLKATF